MNPCKCGSNRLMNIYGKHSDRFHCEISHLNIEHEGYAPLIPGICGGDDTSFTFCLDCGLIQNYESIDDGSLIELLIKDDDQEKEYHNQQTDDEYDAFLVQQYGR